MNECQWESLALLKRPVADGKKLFLWCEVLVLMDRSLLPEGSSWNREWPGWEESATNFLTRLRVLEVCRSSRVGRLHLLSSADDTLQSALVLGSGSSVPDGDGGGEDGLNDGCVEVHHHCLPAERAIRITLSDLQDIYRETTQRMSFFLQSIRLLNSKR